MTTAYAIQTILEILAVLFVVYGILNEKKFVAFENKVCRIIRRKLILYKKRKAASAEKAKRTVAVKVHSDKPVQAGGRRNIYSAQFVA